MKGNTTLPAKGQTNNPSGRSSDVQNAAQRILSALAEAATPDKLHRMAARVMTKAAKGDLAAISVVCDRLIGKPKQVFEGAINGTFKAYIGFNPDDPADGKS